MSRENTLMRQDATERLLAEADQQQTAIDTFVDQTRHIYEHGGSLTALGQLILEERLHITARPVAYCP